VSSEKGKQQEEEGQNHVVEKDKRRDRDRQESSTVYEDMQPVGVHNHRVEVEWFEPSATTGLLELEL